MALWLLVARAEPLEELDPMEVVFEVAPGPDPGVAPLPLRHLALEHLGGARVLVLGGPIVGVVLQQEELLRQELQVLSTHYCVLRRMRPRHV